MITKILAKLEKQELFKLLRKCDEINQKLSQDNKLRMQETLEKLKENRNIGM